MACILDGGELTLSGDVGDYFGFDCFTHGDVVQALAQVEDTAKLTIFLNSGGGVASDGAAIHALLSRRAGPTDIVVDGVAASAASLIAMAGDTVTMSAGSVMMIHDPANFSFGTAAEHERTVGALNALGTAYARVYAAKSGKTPDECRAIMKTERWYSPDEAVAEGFADRTSVDEAATAAAFDYRTYAHAPKRLTALAAKKNWRLPDAKKAAASAADNRQPQETSMTDKERADQLAAELADLKAQMKAGKDAEADAALQEELATLRADKVQRDNADAIMALDEAKGREAQAKALAAAGVKPEAAKAILAAAPKPADADEEDDPDPKAFERQRMQASGQAQPGGGKGKAAATINRGEIFASRRKSA